MENRITMAEGSIGIYINHALCKGTEGCGLCIHICPRDVYGRSEFLTERGVRPPEPVRADACNACGICMMYCPDFAIVIEKT